MGNWCVVFWINKWTSFFKSKTLKEKRQELQMVSLTSLHFAKVYSRWKVNQEAKKVSVIKCDLLKRINRKIQDQWKKN